MGCGLDDVEVMLDELLLLEERVNILVDLLTIALSKYFELFLQVIVFESVFVLHFFET